MHNESKTISANEINKYSYCPYQWYYERYYGTTQLRQMYKKRNKKLNLNNKTLSNFKRGLQYHAEYGTQKARPGKAKAFKRVFFLSVAAFGSACAVWAYCNLGI